MSRRWTRADYTRPADELAPELLGQILVSLAGGERRAGRIVETEAYLGAEDLASHAVGGRRTARTEPMWGPPGLAYVYVSYGIHRCMNVVAGEKGDAHAVLIRAVEPVEGIGAMRAARAKPGRRTELRDRDLCSGPGKLCEALGITLERTGEDMTRSDRLWIEPGERPAGEIVRLPRVGLGDAGVWTHEPLRWCVRGHAHVSRR